MLYANEHYKGGCYNEVAVYIDIDIFIHMTAGHRFIRILQRNQEHSQQEDRIDQADSEPDV